MIAVASEWIMLAVGLLLTVGTGLFVASEFALVNLDRGDLEARRERGESRLTMTIADAWQRRGVGSHLVRAAVDVARREGVDNLVAELDAGNAGMRELLADQGFAFAERDGTLVATLRIA